MALSALEEGPFLGRLLGLPQASAALNEEPAPYRTSAPTPPQGATVDVPTTGQPGLELRTVVSVLQKGLPASSFQVLCDAWQLPRDRMADAVSIAPRTVARRKVFKADESERIFRLGTVFQAAVNLFNGDENMARDWLQRPQFGLGGATPLEFARTEPGAQEVRSLIGRLDEGIFA